jgi:hypothetical protein
MPSTAAKKQKTLYSVHPGVEMMVNWVATLKEKTGRSLEEWTALVKKSGPAATAKRREWLKKTHGLGTTAAWWIVERAEGRGGEDASPQAYLKAAEQYVEEMFSGGRAGLRPVYDRLLALGLAAGADAKARPCKTIVPLYRELKSTRSELPIPGGKPQRPAVSTVRCKRTA